MIIDSIYIERFGVLRDKRLDKIRPDVEVIYAPNETGKTTFLQFIRCMLFGMHGGKAYAFSQNNKLGGRLTFHHSFNSNTSGRTDRLQSQFFTISRSLRCSTSVAVNDEAEQVELVNGYREPQSITDLQKILGNVDSKIYSQIFAITQDDLHSFDLLSSAAATRILYQMSLAQGQNSLTELSARLESERRELLNNIIDDAHPTDGKLKELIFHRQELKESLEVEQNRQLQRRQLQTKLPELESQLTQIHKQLEQIQNQLSELERLEKAYPIFEQWKQTEQESRGTINDKQDKNNSWFSWGNTTNNKSNVPNVTDYALEQSRKLELELSQLQSRLNSLQSELQRIPEDKPVQKSSPVSVKANIPDNLQELQAKRSDFVRLHELENQKTQLIDRLQAVWDTLCLPGKCCVDGIPKRETLITLQSVWAKQDETHQVEYEEEIPVETDEVTDTSPTNNNTKSVTDSFIQELIDKRERYKQQLKSTKEYLALLREKYRWIERRNDLEWGEKQVRNRLTILTTTPAVSTSMKYSLIAVTALGALGLILWTFYLFGWIAKESLLGSIGTFSVILCFCGLTGVVIMRYLLEKSAEDRLIDCRTHWENTKKQLEEHLSLLPELEIQLRNSSSDIDIPALQVGESPDEMADTLHAINELIEKSKKLGKIISELERNITDNSVVEVKPVTSAPRIIYQTVKRYKTEKVYTDEQFQQLWLKALQGVHLPSSWTIAQINLLLNRIEWLNDQLENRKNLERQIQILEQNLNSARNQLNRCVEKYNLKSSSYSEIELIDKLVQNCTQYEAQPVTDVTPKNNPRRTELQNNIKQTEENIRLAKSKLQYLFNEYNVRTTSELDTLYIQQKQASEQEQKQAQAEQKQLELFLKIQKTLNRPVSDDKEMYSIFKSYSDFHSVTYQKELLSKKNEQLHHSKEQLEQELFTVKRQQYSYQENNTSEQSQQTLERLEKQITQTAQRWRALAMAQKIANTLVQEYENTRQPETLAWASQYFQSMTNGVYEQILKPSNDCPLVVQRHDGRLLTVGHLSTGTREELYLSLRLALATWYAQQGTVLPLILDDAMSNFDSERAKCAAKTILNVARQGIQIILLTCHKSVRDAFEKCDTEVRRF